MMRDDKVYLAHRGGGDAGNLRNLLMLRERWDHLDAPTEGEADAGNICNILGGLQSGELNQRLYASLRCRTRRTRTVTISS